MARVVFSNLITKVTGKIGNVVYSSWKGIYTAKSLPINQAYAWTSPNNADNRANLQTLINSWNNDLDPTQRTDWETYAVYLATLPTNYVKITGWHQYGGIMSSYNAFVLCNMIRFSVGYTDVLEDAPLAMTSPVQPTLTDLVLHSTNPNVLRVDYPLPSPLYADTTLRLWMKGRSKAHLIIAGETFIPQSGTTIWDVNYEADQLPPAATPPWTLAGSECGSIALSILTVDPSRGGYLATFYLINAPGVATERHLETRIKIHAAAGYHSVMLQGTTDGVNIWLMYLKLFQDHIELWDISGLLGSYTMNTTTDFNVYNMDWVSGVATVSVNSTPVIVKPCTTTQVDTPKIYFGKDTAGTMVAEYDYVKFRVGPPGPPTPTYIDVSQLQYTKGVSLPVIKDTYDAQLDCVDQYGRFSPPSQIKTLIVH
jgi:hypothetical protein